jgi:hypothetical protein
MVPQPVLAVLLLFPITNASEAAKSQGAALPLSFSLCWSHSLSIPSTAMCTSPT